MKKTIISGITLATSNPVVYKSFERSLPASDRKFANAVLSYLAETVKSEDDIKFILLVKTNGDDRHEENIRVFKEEVDSLNKGIGAKVEYVIISTEFYEESGMQEDLLLSIVENIEIGSHITADITYGSKESPIIVFSALSYAKRFLQCEIDKIIYGHTEFTKDREIIPEKTRLSDMTSLFYLSSLTNKVNCEDPEKAKRLLRSIVKG